MAAAKTAAKVVLTITLVLSFICIFGASEDGSVLKQMLWTASSIGAFYLSARGLDKLGAFGEDSNGE